MMPPLQSVLGLEYSEVFALVLGLVGMLLVLLMSVGIPRKVLDTERRLQEAVVNSQLVSWSGWKTVVYTPDEASPERIKRLARGEEEVESPSAVRGIKQTIGAGIPSLSGLSRKFALEAILTAVFGYLAVVGVVTFDIGFNTDTGVTLGQVLDTVLSIATSIPFVDTVFALVLAVYVSVASWIYGLWWLIALVLVAAAVMLYEYEEELSEREQLVLKLIAVVPIPFILVYVIGSLDALQKLLDVVTATTVRQVVALLAVGVIVGVVIVRGIRSVPDVQARVSEYGARASITALARAGVKPVATVVIIASVAGVGAIIGFPLVYGVGAGVVLALVYRVVYGLYSRVRFRQARSSEDRSRPRSSVVVEAGKIEDADGETLWVVSVQGERLMSDDLDEVAVDAANTTGELLREGTRRPTLSRYHYQAATEGTVSREEAMKELRQTIRSDLRDGVDGGAPRKRVHEYLSAEYPQPFGDRVLKKLVYDEGVIEPAGDEYRLV
ncbi:hypothetical protein N0B31_10235 [Salinirubellus salinus]|uniref:Uncharacterized protein n=1 Tax=Salinirubellus salinus TaxID=1364945 RepID=A0A9E7R7F3_9EURY|nr:hypothetical protein [Salinirubellus salinus]UWM56653.1 hypothetical protein N0B31_10235 [Salinirubellus salinus]